MLIGRGNCRIKDLSKIYLATSDSYSHSLAEALASLLASIVSAKDVSHIFAAHTAVGKNVFPRLAGLLDSSLVGRHRTHSAFFH